MAMMVEIIQKFYMAAVNRDLSKLEECVLVDGVDVNYIFTEPYISSHHTGGTALHIVAEKGHTAIIEDMLMLEPISVLKINLVILPCTLPVNMEIVKLFLVF